MFRALFVLGLFALFSACNTPDDTPPLDTGGSGVNMTLIDVAVSEQDPAYIIKAGWHYDPRDRHCPRFAIVEVEVAGDAMSFAQECGVPTPDGWLSGRLQQRFEEFPQELLFTEAPDANEILIEVLKRL